MQQKTMVYYDITLHLKLLVLHVLYADDKVILEQMKKTFQNNLDTVFEYSDL